MRGLETWSGDQRKPRLLVLTSTYPRWLGDPEPGFVHELSKRLAAQFQVTVLCPREVGAETRENLEGVTVIRYRYAPAKLESLVSGGGLLGNLKAHPWKVCLLPAFLLGQLISLFWLIRTLKPDVIHAHWLVPQGICAALLQKFTSHSVPFLVTSHGADLFALNGKLFRVMKRLVLGRAAHVTVVSRTMKSMVQRLGASDEKVSVQPMGVNLSEAFKPTASNFQAGLEVLFVGRLVEKKGLEYLISAMPIILQRYATCTLRIVGFGPQLDALKAQVVELGLTSNVVFEGAVPNSELPMYYQRASVFVAPFIEAMNGDQEGLGLVLVEALGSGCPAVVSDIAAAEDVTEGVGGVISVPQKSVDAIASAISEIFDNQDSFKDEAVKSGSIIKDRFNWDAVAARYGNILQSLVRGDVQR